MEDPQQIQGRYTLEERLGQGGMAEVWRARDERLERTVAIKFISPRLASDPEFLVRFFAEAQAVAAISHPHVVQVLDFGQHEDRPYLVMECMPGGSLDSLVGAALLPERALELIAEAADGLEAAHQRGLVHRDIKPGNILLDGEGVAKLADFGIAVSSNGEHLTDTGSAIGSPHYISPEQVEGKTATASSDIYSLGVVLYELLTGTRPFEAENVTALAIAHVDKTPEPPSVRNPDLPDGIDALVLRAMAKDPEERFVDARSFAVAMRRAAHHRPIPHTVAGGPREARPPRRPSLAGAAVVTLLLLSAIASLLVAAAGEEPVEAGTDAVVEAEERTKRSSPSPSPSSSPSPAETFSDAAVVSASSPTPEPKKEERKKSKSKQTEAEAENDGAAGATEEPAEEEPAPTPSQEPAPSPSAEPSTDPGTSPAPEPSPSP